VKLNDERGVRIRMAGPSNIELVRKLLIGPDSACLKTMGLPDIVALLTTHPIVSLLAFDREKPVAVLLGSRRFQHRLPNKRDLPRDAYRPLDRLAVKYNEPALVASMNEDNTLFLRNGFIVLVHVAQN
jgi:hypothetical protein